MKSTFFLAGAIALFTGMATANVHPKYERQMLCAQGIRRAGLKCNTGDVIHVKRDSEPNKFHISITDAEGNAVTPDVEDTGFFDDDDEEEDKSV